MLHLLTLSDQSDPSRLALLASQSDLLVLGCQSTLMVQSDLQRLSVQLQSRLRPWVLCLQLDLWVLLDRCLPERQSDLLLHRRRRESMRHL